jgi:DNA-binding MarR family transcriptional regulator
MAGMPNAGSCCYSRSSPMPETTGSDNRLYKINYSVYKSIQFFKAAKTMKQDSVADQDGVAADPTIDQFPLTDQAGHLLRRCQQRAVDLFVEEVTRDLGEHGPTPRQFAVLLCVHQRPGINQTDLVRMSGIDRSTLTEILRRLIDRGLIRRERTQADLRTNALFVTEPGEKLLRRALPAVMRAQRRIMAPIPADRVDDVLAALETLANPPGED